MARTGVQKILWLGAGQRAAKMSQVGQPPHNKLDDLRAAY